MRGIPGWELVSRCPEALIIQTTLLDPWTSLSAKSMVKMSVLPRLSPPVPKAEGYGALFECRAENPCGKQSRSNRVPESSATMLAFYMYFLSGSARSNSCIVFSYL
jgi:hypothetical protein